MIVFSAIVPHSPILIPQIGKDNIDRLRNTVRSYEKLSVELLESGAQTVFIISPHGVIQDDTFSMNLSPRFKANFEAFGDFSSKDEWVGDIGLAYKIREALETKAPLQLMTEENLDHGTSVPLIKLLGDKKDFKIIPLYYSGLSREAHFKFGRLLRRELQRLDTNIALVASGDLSHRVTKDAPGGYSPRGKKFDQKLIEILKQKEPEKLLKMHGSLIEEAQECGLKSILILMGIMEGIGHTPRLLSYEAPFGVGYMVMDFKL